MKVRPSPPLSTADRPWWVLWWVAARIALGVLLLVCVAPYVQAQSSALAAHTDRAQLQRQVQAFLKAQAMPRAPQGHAGPAWRVQWELGQLDSRLRLASCENVQAYLPAGSRLWGSTRVGLRCERGPVRWNVYWPVKVQVWSEGLVASTHLRPGQLITQDGLQMAEVDLAASSSPALLDVSDVLGRSVQRTVAPGHALREDDLKARRWFLAGDVVQLRVKGQGFAIGSQGQALGPGDEGRCARIRLDGGKVVCAEPVGERLAEILL